MRLSFLRLCVVLVSIALSHSLAFSGSIYRFKDDNGRWVFTDSPYLAEGAQQTELPDTPLEREGYGLYLSEGEQSFKVHAYNEMALPIQIELTSTQGASVGSATPSLPLRQVIKPGDDITLTSMRGSREEAERLNYRFVFGDPQATHRPENDYRLPFLPSDRYRVSQAFNGHFSHQSEYSRYAVDIAMPLDSIICAARGGIFAQVESSNYLGGPDADKYAKLANVIRILHDDGTMALYAHLQMETIVLDVGDRVERGQVIARSGNTGFSTGPHLHFVIHRNVGMKMISVPFSFTTGTPYPGQWLSFDG